jgi:hypothetical protein
MYGLDGEGLAMPWIYNAMRRRNDDIGRDKGACALDPAPVASHVDLAN